MIDLPEVLELASLGGGVATALFVFACRRSIEVRHFHLAAFSRPVVVIEPICTLPLPLRPAFGVRFA